MFCSPKLYHHNDTGFTRQCNCQNAIHLTFGNVSLLLTRPQLNELAGYIFEILIKNFAVEDRDHKCIYLPTYDQCLTFVMTYNELKKLFEILENTEMILEIEEALNINTNEP